MSHKVVEMSPGCCCKLHSEQKHGNNQNMSIVQSLFNRVVCPACIKCQAIIYAFCRQRDVCFFFVPESACHSQRNKLLCSCQSGMQQQPCLAPLKAASLNPPQMQQCYDNPNVTGQGLEAKRVYSGSEESFKKKKKICILSFFFNSIHTQYTHICFTITNNAKISNYQSGELLNMP